MYKKGVYVDRPKLKSYPKKRSEWIVKFEKRYNRKITDKNFIDKHILSIKGQNQILSKGRGAYYSSGSRPNQTADSWAYARVASSITGGKSSKVDYHILEKTCKKGSKALKLAKKNLKLRKTAKRKIKI